MENNTCVKCNETKLISDFIKDKSRQLGVSNACKMCKWEYSKNHYIRKLRSKKHKNDKAEKKFISFNYYQITNLFN